MDEARRVMAIIDKYKESFTDMEVLEASNDLMKLYNMAAKEQTDFLDALVEVQFYRAAEERRLRLLSYLCTRNPNLTPEEFITAYERSVYVVAALHRDYHEIYSPIDNEPSQ